MRIPKIGFVITLLLLPIFFVYVLASSDTIPLSAQSGQPATHLQDDSLQSTVDAAVSATFAPFPLTLTAVDRQVATAEAQLAQTELNAINSEALFHTEQSARQAHIGEYQNAVSLAVESFADYPTVYNAESGNALFNALQAPVRQSAVFFHQRTVNSMSLNDDNSRVLSWSWDGTARVWDALTGELMLTLPHHSIVQGAAWNSDETNILTWALDRAFVWDAETGEIVHSLPYEGGVRGARWSQDDTQMFTWDLLGTVTIWDAVTGEVIRTIHHDTESDFAFNAAWSDDDTRLATWSDDNTVRLWDVETGDLLTSIHPDSYPVNVIWNTDATKILTRLSNSVVVTDAATGEVQLALSHDTLINDALWDEYERRILTSSGDAVWMWDAITGERLYTIHPGQTSFVMMVSPNGSRLLTYERGGGIPQLWSAYDGEPVQNVPTISGLQNASWNTDGTRLATSNGSTLRVWDMETGDQLMAHTNDSLYEGGGSVFNLGWSDDGSRLLASYTDGSVRLFNLEPNPVLLEIPIMQRRYEEIDGAAWFADETRILSWTSDGALQVWDGESGEELPLIPEFPGIPFPHGSNSIDVEMNSDATRMLTWGYDDSSVTIWDVEAGQQLLKLQQETEGQRVRGAIWNGDETQVLTWGESGIVRVWDAITGAELHQFRQDGAIQRAVWNADETQILTWLWDSSAIRIWDTTTEEFVFDVPNAHEGRIGGAAWNPSETQVLTWSYDDGAARLWDAQTGAPLLELPNDDGIANAVWSSTGDQIVTASSNNGAHVWDAVSGELLNHLPHSDYVYRAVWNSDETRIMTTTFSTVTIWDALTGEQIFELPIGHNEGGIQARWNADESLILTLAADTQSRLWNAETGEEVLSLGRYVRGATWNTDETALLTWTDHPRNGGMIRVMLTDIDELLALGEAQAAVEPLNNIERRQFFLPTVSPTAATIIPSLTRLPTLTPTYPPTSTPSATPLSGWQHTYYRTGLGGTLTIRVNTSLPSALASDTTTTLNTIIRVVAPDGSVTTYSVQQDQSPGPTGIYTYRQDFSVPMQGEYTFETYTSVGDTIVPHSVLVHYSENAYRPSLEGTATPTPTASATATAMP
jgi:WD40 repeat protein